MVDGNVDRLQPLFKLHRRGLRLVARQHDAADVQTVAAEGLYQAQHVRVVGDVEVAALLALFDIAGVDRDDDLRLILELEQHLHLAVRLEARQHPRRVIVVEELAAEFQIELAAEGADPLADVLGLELHILVVVETDALHIPYLPKYTAQYI